MNGFIAQMEAEASASCVPSAPTWDERRAAAGCDGLSHRRGDTQLLGIRPQLRPRRPHVRGGEGSWSLPAHLYLVSAWSARCQSRSPMSCVNNIFGPYIHHRADQAVAQQLATGAAPIHRRGPTSPGCCTPSTSAGPTTCNQAASPTATTARPSPAPGPAERPDSGELEPAAAVHRRAARPPGAQRPGGCSSYFAAARARRPALGGLDHPDPVPTASIRPPASSPGAGVRHRTGQRGHERPRLGQHRDLPDLGRLGRLLRPRRAAPGRSATATACGCRRSSFSPYAKTGYIDHQILSSDAFVKFIEDDFLGGAAPRPGDRRPARPPPGRAGERADPGQPGQRLQLQPATAQAAAAAHQPAHRLTIDPALLHPHAGLHPMHHPASRHLTRREPLAPAPSASQPITIHLECPVSENANRRRHADWRIIARWPWTSVSH